MGRRGPQPIPTSVKLKRGETRPSRLNLTEPIPRDRRPSVRADWSESKKVIARRILRETPRGQITAADQAAFDATVEAEDRYRLTARAYANQIGILRGRDGGPVVSPLFRVLRDSSNDLRLWLRELGLTPAARAGLHVSGEEGLVDGIEGSIGPSPRLRAVAGGRLDEDADDT